MNQRRARAVTLVELLVSMALAALLLTAVYMALVASNSTLTWMGAHADAQSSAVVALNRFELELRMSSYSTLTITSAPPAPPSPAVLDISFETEDPAAVTMSSFTPLTAGGYAQFVVYYFSTSTGSWNRRVWTDSPAPSPDPASVGRLSSAQLINAAGGTNTTDEALAAGVVTAVSNPQQYPVATEVNGIKVTLTIQKTDNQGRAATQTVSALANPRNQP